MEKEEVIMNMIRWEPIRESEDFVSRLMPSLFRGWPPVAGNGKRAFEWAPNADISETEKEYLIRAELPAVRKEDVRVLIDNGTIMIEGERKYEKEEKDETFHRVESFQGRFARSFMLPDDADAAAIRAESKDGVLTVHLPKSKVAQPRAVQVKVD
jgi:HSP20 family protein